MAIFSTRLTRTTKLVLVPCLLIWMLLVYAALVRRCRCQLSQLSVKQMTVFNDRPFSTSPIATSAVPSSGNETSVTATQQRHSEQKDHRYLPSIKTEEKLILFDLAEKFVDVCTLRNITHFMYGGTLLGSYRHHDLIPWDDDFDVLVNVSQRAALYQALTALSPRYLVADAGPRLKFFSSLSNSTSSYPWKWPYIDICFFNYNGTHVGDSSGEFSAIVFPKSITFPLHARPLGTMYMNAPFDSYATLLRTYDDLHLCATHHYSHKTEIGGGAVSKIPCARLRDSVPFVHRSASSKGIRETLMRGESIIHSLVVDEPRYAVVSPFTLDLP